MSQETNRIKIRELDPTTAISSDDQLAIAVTNPDRTLRVSVSDVVQTGITLQAGSNISITKQGTIHTIAATPTAHDDSALADRVLALENKLNNLSVGSSVTTSPAPPVDAVQGDMWWDTNTARLYVRYNNVWGQCNPTGDSPVQVNLTGGTVTLPSVTSPPVDDTGNTPGDSEGSEVVATGVIQITPGTAGQTTSGPWTDLPGYDIFTPGDVAVVTDVSEGSYTEPEDPRYGVGAVDYGSNGGFQYNSSVTKTWGMDVTADPSTGRWTATYTGTPPTLNPATGSFTLTIYRSG